MIDLVADGCRIDLTRKGKAVNLFTNPTEKYIKHAWGDGLNCPPSTFLNPRSRTKRAFLFKGVADEEKSKRALLRRDCLYRDNKRR